MAGAKGGDAGSRAELVVEALWRLRLVVHEQLAVDDEVRRGRERRALLRRHLGPRLFEPREPHARRLAGSAAAQHPLGVAAERQFHGRQQVAHVGRALDPRSVEAAHLLVRPVPVELESEAVVLCLDVHVAGAELQRGGVKAGARHAQLRADVDAEPNRRRVGVRQHAALCRLAHALQVVLVAQHRVHARWRARALIGWLAEPPLGAAEAVHDDLGVLALLRHGVARARPDAQVAQQDAREPLDLARLGDLSRQAQQQVHLAVVLHRVETLVDGADGEGRRAPRVDPLLGERLQHQGDVARVAERHALVEHPRLAEPLGAHLSDPQPLRHRGGQPLHGEAIPPRVVVRHQQTHDVKEAGTRVPRLLPS